MKKRKQNPSVETKVLFKNRFTCCICHDDSKEVIVHHIDGNPNNTTEENLAVLCLEHASKADAGLKKGKLGAGRKLTPDLVKKFKQAWEEKVKSEFKLKRKILSQKKKEQIKVLYEFEINKIKNEILSFSKNDKKEIKRKFNFLSQLLIEEFITGIKFRRILLQAFSDLAVLTPLDKHITIPLINAIRDLSLHLIGPPDVKLTQEDKRTLNKSIEILETIGCYEASLSKKDNVLNKTCKAILELAEVASWYKQKDIIKKSKRILEKIKKECNLYEGNKRTIQKKQKLIEEFIREIKKL